MVFKKMQLKVTSSVYQRITELAQLEQIAQPILRVSVEGGGCNGFMYKYQFTKTTKEDDYVTEQDGIKVVVDQLSGQFLDGCVIDFVDTLGSSYFEITNPNAKFKCGCGNSFST